MRFAANFSPQKITNWHRRTCSREKLALCKTDPETCSKNFYATLDYFPATTMIMKLLCIRDAPDRTFYYPAEYQIYVIYIDGKYPTRLSGQMLDIE